MKSVVDKLCALEDRMSIFEEQINSIKAVQEEQAVEISDLKRKFNEHDSNLTASVIDEVSERHKRRKNIILRGVAESVGSVQERTEADREVIQDVLNEMNIDRTTAVRVSRLGQRVNEGSRLVKVVMTTEDLRQECLQKSRILRNTRFRNVFVHPDRTPSEQKADQDKRRRLKALKEAGQDVVLYRGEIRLRGDLGFRH